MTTRIDAYDFLQAVKQGSQARLPKSPMPVLTGILLRRINGTVQVLSTDLEEFDVGACAAFGDEEQFEIVLPGNPRDVPVLAWLKALEPKKATRRKGEWQSTVLTIEILPHICAVQMVCDNITATFKGTDAGEFPLLPEDKVWDKIHAEREQTRKRKPKPSPEEVLSRHAEERWQTALKATKRMSYEEQVAHWQTWGQLLPEHEADIQTRVSRLAKLIAEQQQAEEVWQAERRQQEDEDHQARLERLNWLESLREGLRAEFESRQRKDKIKEMREPVVCVFPFWSFSTDEADAPDYSTSYDWLEAVFVWNGRVLVGRGKSRRYRSYRPKYSDVMLGYEVTPK